jgi:hypothetical protein
MAVAFGPIALLLLMALNPGGTPNDLVSWIKPEDYFQAREIELNSKEMRRLAGSAPKNAKASFQQLLALRWLSEHPSELKKEKEARQLLETLAAGKNGDAQGFAREYAATALAILDGKAPATRTMPENSVKVDALSWFPEKSAFCGAADLRASDSKLPADDTLLKFGQRALLLAPASVRNELYGFGEAVGNVRLDRVSFALQVDPSNTNKNKIYLRLTGLADRGRLAEFLQNSTKGATVKEEKGPKGEPITIIDQGDMGQPSLALVGDNDWIMAGYASRGPGMGLVKDMLAVRAAGKGSVASGPLADLLKQAPASATALLVGEVPEIVRKELAAENNPFGTIPDRFLIDKTTGKTTDIRWQGTFRTADDAKAFAASAAKLKEQGVAGLKAIQGQIKIKKETVDLVTKTLEGIKADADGKTVKGGVQISPDLTRAVVEVMDLFLMASKGLPKD